MIFGLTRQWSLAFLPEEKPEINMFAVRQVLFARQTTGAVAASYSVSELTVRTWVRNFEKKFPRNRFDWSSIDELSQLKKENKRLLAEKTSLVAALAAKEAKLKQPDDCEF